MEAAEPNASPFTASSRSPRAFTSGARDLARSGALAVGMFSRHRKGVLEMFSCDPREIPPSAEERRVFGMTHFQRWKQRSPMHLTASSRSPRVFTSGARIWRAAGPKSSECSAVTEKVF